MDNQREVIAETGESPSPGAAPPGLMMAGQKGNARWIIGAEDGAGL